MKKYKALMKMGFYHFDDHAKTLILALFIGSLAANPVVHYTLDSGFSLGFVVAAGLSVFAIVAATLFVGVFVPLVALRYARKVRFEYGPKTYQTLIDHFFSTPKKPFDPAIAAIKNKELFY